MDRQLAPRRSWWPTLGLAISLAVALVTFGLARARAQMISVAREDVTLDVVKRETLVQTVSGPGRLVPLHVRWLTATHRARVERVTMQPGDRVQADTVVAVLQNPEIDLALLEAERQLAAARIQVAGTRRQLDQLGHDVVLSLSGVTEQQRLAGEELRRLVDLQTEGVASSVERERAASLTRELTLRVQLLEQQRAAVEEARGSELGPGYALVAALERMVAHQRREREDLTLSSGAAGVVHSVTVEPGQWVESGALLAKVIVSEELQAELQIDELDARNVTVGQVASIVLGSARLRGSVSRVDPMASEGTVLVEVTLAEAAPDLRADQRVSGEIEVARHAAVLSLRAPAQVTRPGRFTLFKRLGPDHLVSTETELVPAARDRVLVQSGLLEGDQVVISDMTRFKEQERLLLR